MQKKKETNKSIKHQPTQKIKSKTKKLNATMKKL